MALDVQVQTDISNHPYIVDGVPLTKRVTLAQDGSRSTVLAKGTVMTYDPTDEDWAPWTDETATDGTQRPCGIILEDIAAATLVAGDVENVSMIVGGNPVVMNEDLLTFENSLTKDTIVNVPTNFNMAAWQCLALLGIYFVDTQEGTSYEA